MPAARQRKVRGTAPNNLAFSSLRSLRPLRSIVTFSLSRLRLRADACRRTPTPDATPHTDKTVVSVTRNATAGRVRLEPDPWRAGYETNDCSRRCARAWVFNVCVCSERHGAAAHYRAGPARTETGPPRDSTRHAADQAPARRSAAGSTAAKQGGRGAGPKTAAPGATRSPSGCARARPRQAGAQTSPPPSASRGSMRSRVPCVNPQGPVEQLRKYRPKNVAPVEPLSCGNRAAAIACRRHRRCD